ncbi:MAG: undecaprenyl-diphosphate phosphatase, partial [Chloroflexi bacterium]|nr:undecaprenyl-diphosphate phosphatase [Chloroflexota bacterium]
QNSPDFLPLVVLFHVGTATALLIYFWRDWVAIARGFVATAISGRLDSDPNGRVAWLLIVGTIPTGLLGLFLETPLKHLFASPIVASGFLIVNGVILLVGERDRHHALASSRSRPGEDTSNLAQNERPNGLDEDEKPATSMLSSFSTVGWRQAVLVGLAQALALLPGISRSGVTMVAALRVGLSHEDAAAYTFLLATPIIGAAGLLEIPQLAGSPPSTLVVAIVGGVLAGVAAYLSTKFLMHYFEKGRLDPFGYYCIAAGLVSSLLIRIRA